MAPLPTKRKFKNNIIINLSIKMTSKIWAGKGPVAASGRFCVSLFAGIGFYSLVIYLLDKTYIWPKTKILSNPWPTTVSPSKIKYFLFQVIFIFFLPLIIDYLRKIKYMTYKKKQHLHTFIFISYLFHYRLKDFITWCQIKEREWRWDCAAAQPSFPFPLLFIYLMWSCSKNCK